MTLPDERYRAVVNAREFLRSLLDPKKTPKVPRAVRKEAYWILKYFPSSLDMELTAEGGTEVFEKPRDRPVTKRKP